MRVIQVNKFHYLKGGAERYYLDVSELLRARGHEVDHLAMAHERNESPRSGDRFVSEVDYRGGMGFSEKIRHGIRAIYNQEAATIAREMARRRSGPTVAHLHNIYHQLSPSVIRAFHAERIPIVQTLHDYKLICPAYLMMTEGEICERCRGGRYYQATRHRCVLESRPASAIATVEAYLHASLRTYHQVDRYLCPSRFLLEKVASFGIPREKLVHLPYLVDAVRYRPSEEPPRPVCVYVGRLSREKGIGTLIEAMGQLPPGSLRLEILGEGPMRESLERRVAATCPDRVRFLGFRSGEELHEIIRTAAFAVVPSEWYENLPFAVLEPFALGTPVVGADIGGIPEMVENGVTGRLHASGDAESLRDALLDDRPGSRPSRNGKAGARPSRTGLRGGSASGAALGDLQRGAGVKIAMVGQKGIPATYGGIERHVEEIATRLVERGHEVHVYSRYHYTHHTGSCGAWRLHRFPSINTKHLDAISHCFFCTAHAVAQGYDLVHYHALGPSVFSNLPRIRGAKSVVTVHGLDWERGKWRKFATWFLRLCGRPAITGFPHRTIIGFEDSEGLLRLQVRG
ncbi:MAG: glycosyltransferase [Candidatus Eisenbacteria bacterium]